MPTPTVLPGNEQPFSTFTELESQVRSYARSFPRIFERAKGSYLYARDGTPYLDFLMGCSSLNYGHNPDELKQALIEYISSDHITHSLDMYSVAKEEFLDELKQTILQPRGMDYLVQFPGPTGANAVEAALKLARKVTGRENVIAFTNGFHGVTLGALACTGNDHHRSGAGIPLGGVGRMPFDGYFGADTDTAEYLDRMLSDSSSGIDKPAAVIVETVQGEGGFNTASFEWLRRIADITHKHGALLIVDDIQSGVGRTGTFFSFEEAGIQPDLITMAKSISGYGLPLALVLIKPEHDIWSPGEHNGTFRGNCPAFVTGRAALQHYWKDPGFAIAISERSQQVKKHFSKLSARFGRERVVTKGRGMMLGLALPDGETASKVVSESFKRGLIIETGGSKGEVIKCLAPLTISQEELGEGLHILEQALASALASSSRAAA